MQAVLEKIREEVALADVFSVSIDEAAAIDRKKYLSIVIYYPTQQGEVKTVCIRLEQIDKLDALNLCETLVGSPSLLHL